MLIVLIEYQLKTCATRPRVTMAAGVSVRPEGLTVCVSRASQVTPASLRSERVLQRTVETQSSVSMIPSQAYPGVSVTMATVLVRSHLQYKMISMNEISHFRT